ncbi:MAG: hypothetical protein KDA85_12355, partial [Planctomycetaceae bacterium]|nr:hypothetical protein [Planctomycetaceae bacterium]
MASKSSGSVGLMVALTIFILLTLVFGAVLGFSSSELSTARVALADAQREATNAGTSQAEQQQRIELLERTIGRYGDAQDVVDASQKFIPEQVENATT